MATIIPFSSKPTVKAEIVAQHLGCCEETILRMARAGRIPAKRIKNGTRSHWRFDLEDVMLSLESSKVAQ
jgi:excisionase family DNA binding protein